MSEHRNSYMTFQEVIGMAAERLGDPAMQELSMTVYANYAGEGCVEFARLSETVHDKATRPLVVDQAEYDLPANCLKVHRVTIIENGYTSYRRLRPVEMDKIEIGYSSLTSGMVQEWYLTRDQARMGLSPAPSEGGYRGRMGTGSTASSIVAPTGVTFPTIVEDTTFRVLDGALAGETTTVDGVATSSTITLATALPGTPAAGTLFECFYDTLLIDYIAEGNRYDQKPIAVEVAADFDATENNVIVTGLSLRPLDWYKGMDLTWTTGNLKDTSLRITGSNSVDTANTRLTVSTPWPTVPTIADTGVVTDVPNIPVAYHHYLSEYVVGCVARDRGNAAKARMAMTRFEVGVQEARKMREFKNRDTYSKVDPYNRGRGKWLRW